MIVTRGMERVWTRVERAGANECWPFRGYRNKLGYGQINIDGTRILAHRAASIATDGPIPDGLCVLHRCDNPPCCNPAHLFRGTRADNAHDAMAKGRHVPPPLTRLRGEANGPSKLTEAVVRQIKRRWSEGEKVTHLATEFAVSHSLVSLIVHGKRWAWL